MAIVPLISFGQNSLSIDLENGWNMIGCVCDEPIDVIDGLSEYADLIVIVKNYLGMSYLPEYSYNGIGDFSPGFGYQIKLIEGITDFSLCEGLIDNMAIILEENASLQADIDSLTSYGCMDNQACNFDFDHVFDDFSCIYPDFGYDCQGSISEYLIGMEAQGGWVFYVDESGQHGLVAAIEDIGEFAWSCTDIAVNSALDQSLGAGMQNTLDIDAAGCQEISIAATQALAYQTEEFSDWFLPSFDEVQEMYYAIGPGSSGANKGGFTDHWYWTSSYAENGIAWSFSFFNGTTFNFFCSSTLNVRPVRSF